MPTWMSALKQWNAKSGTWCVPRKGTVAYAEVLKLMHPEAEGLVKKMKQDIEMKVKSQMKKEDRYLATFSSDQLKTVKVAYTVRATFNGDFEYPSFEVLDMFNPNIYGKIAHTKIQVKEAK